LNLWYHFRGTGSKNRYQKAPTPGALRHFSSSVQGLAGDLDRVRAQVAKRGGCAGGGRRGWRGADGRRAEDGRRGKVRAVLGGGATPRPWIGMASTTTRRPRRPRGKGRLVRGGRAVGATSGRRAAQRGADSELGARGGGVGWGAGGADGRGLPQNDLERGEKEGEKWGPLKSNPNKHSLEGIVFLGRLDASNPI
jgi:hypothetical protein